METFDEMTMCLPYRTGGYNIEQPSMNHLIRLSEKAERIAGRSKCYGDMCWPKAHVDVEHHGKLDHSSPEDALADRARVNGIEEMGYTVIELTGKQVSDLYSYEYIIQRIAKLLGKRIRKTYLGATPSRIALRQELFEWNHSFGRIP